MLSTAIWVSFRLKLFILHAIDQMNYRCYHHVIPLKLKLKFMPFDSTVNIRFESLMFTVIILFYFIFYYADANAQIDPVLTTVCSTKVNIQSR